MAYQVRNFSALLGEIFSAMVSQLLLGQALLAGCMAACGLKWAIDIHNMAITV